MLRIIGKRLNECQRICNQQTYNIISNEINIQSVRWHVRRPWALGTSKSKLFRIPVHPEYDPDELKELKRLRFIYK